MPIIKEKKPSGLVFSLCKMSVVVGVTEGRTAVAVFLVHTEERAAGPRPSLVSVCQAWGGSPRPQASCDKAGSGAGARGRTVTPHGFLRKVELKTFVSFLHCFPFQMVLLSMLIFHSAFFLISRVAYEWCFFFFFICFKIS